jgi:hypothetical protein
MLNSCDQSAPPWPRPRGPSWPSAGAEGAQPNGAVASFCLGLEPPMALCLIPPARALPAADALPQSRLRWCSTCWPGRPSPGRLPACLQWLSASGRPRGPRPGGANVGMAPRYGACCARRPPRESPTVAEAAPRLPVGAKPPYRRWALASVHSQPQRRSGWPGRCPPAAAPSPAKRPSTAWSVMCPWPAATIQPLSIDAAAASAVASGGSRAVVARCLPATMIPAAGAIRMRCGWPSARAARRARPPRRSWTPSGGRSAAVSGALPPAARLHSHGRRGGLGCPRLGTRAVKRGVRSWRSAHANKRGGSISPWQR